MIKLLLLVAAIFLLMRLLGPRGGNRSGNNSGNQGSTGDTRSRINKSSPNESGDIEDAVFKDVS